MFFFVTVAQGCHSAIDVVAVASCLIDVVSGLPRVAQGCHSAIDVVSGLLRVVRSAIDVVAVASCLIFHVGTCICFVRVGCGCHSAIDV